MYSEEATLDVKWEEKKLKKQVNLVFILDVLVQQFQQIQGCIIYHVQCIANIQLFHMSNYNH